MFDRIAGPYDRLNRVISLGRDQKWRRSLIKMAGVKSGDLAVDMGTGTGDLGMALAEVVGPNGCVLGLDLSFSMLRIAQSKREAAPWYAVHRASAAATGLHSGIADVVTMGWVLRNVGDRLAIYQEVLRVLKPGGVFVCLDMSRPQGWFARAGFWTYRHGLLPVLARLGGGDGQAYDYLAGSTDQFPLAKDLAIEWTENGFESVQFRRLMMGALAIHLGRKQS
jgi:demethylmenaquinone methyltransferase/2-methoxy-6-polyprenyl-1,4-benzoquinol methylase